MLTALQILDCRFWAPGLDDARTLAERARHPAFGLTDATHGMTLAAVSLPYYRHILPYGLAKFRRFAVNVWNVNPEGKTDEEIAKEGLAAMEAWMRELGLVMNITELGATPDMLEKLADVTIILKGGYKTLTRDEVIEIFKESL